ncbi:AraC family transcriptional regulator ligand-binding domain-containing protein [Acinetobacter sp. Tr-809]|uniref:AraC family transcriptional regulator ligand-binding domain-containing protein n=1 Tax=Acinetobacter sp. Tr-809 TaxID=2608324 RepID=UPI00141F1B4F|nr:AraC family transcriptional regulator ligand-binding domain-containing protein [Acinetobacter sp. Tr-809]
MGALQGYRELMLTLNCDPSPFLVRHNIDYQRLNDSDAFIEIASLINLLEESSHATGCPDFGLKLTQHQNQDMLGLYLILLQHSFSIEQAINDASNYIFLHSPSMRLLLDKNQKLFKNCASLYFDIKVSEFISQRQMIDGCLGRIFLTCTQQFNIQPQHIKAISIPHSPTAPKSAYQRFFKVPVYFEQPFAAIHFDINLLKIELFPTNTNIRDELIRDISKNYSQLQTQSMIEKVQYLIRSTIGFQQISKNDIASLLNMHPRTLQRKLSNEGSNFEIIKETVYKQISQSYLLETNIPIKQISSILGYSEPSIFTRACDRWFNKTPKEIRINRKL